MIDSFKDLIFLIVMLALGCTLAFGLVITISTIGCSELARTTGHETQFSLFGGGRANCLINIDGQWIPTSNWLVNSGN